MAKPITPAELSQLAEQCDLQIVTRDPHVILGSQFRKLVELINTRLQATDEEE